MRRSCDSCIHENVCKYKADYAELLKEKQAAIKKNNENIFEAIIDCKYYGTAEFIYKVEDVDYTPPYLNTRDIMIYDPCKDCWVKEHNRNIDFGDNPCYYCSKNPYEATYKSDSVDDSTITSVSKSMNAATSTYTLSW